MIYLVQKLTLEGIYYTAKNIPALPNKPLTLNSNLIHTSLIKSVPEKNQLKRVGVVKKG